MGTAHFQTRAHVRALRSLMRCCCALDQEQRESPLPYRPCDLCHCTQGTFDGPAPQQDRQGAARGAPAGPDPVLEQLLRQVRSKHVRRHFFAHAPSEYTEAKDVRVLAGTYNVAGKRPPPGAKLHEWVGQWRDSWPQVRRRPVRLRAVGGLTRRGRRNGHSLARLHVVTASLSGGKQLQQAGAAPRLPIRARRPNCGLSGCAPARQVSSGGPGPDIVAVGFQEVVPLNAGNALLGPTSEGADAWDMALAATLNGEEW